MTVLYVKASMSWRMVTTPNIQFHTHPQQQHHQKPSHLLMDMTATQQTLSPPQILLWSLHLNLMSPKWRGSR